MFGIIKAAATFIAEAIGLADRQTVEKASTLDSLPGIFARDAERHETDHTLALSGGRRRLANNAAHLKNGGSFRPED